MGLYYNPPNPNIGRQQPLDPIKLDPPQSGPAPQNPPFTMAAAMALGAVLIAAWTPPPPGPNMGNAQPYAQEVLSPPISVPQNPPFNGGARVSREILIDWIPLPPDPFMGRWQPLEARKLVPPQSAPSMIPVGAQVPQAVLVWWVPPAPGPNQGNAQPYAQELLSPPTSGPAPQNPPFAGGPQILDYLPVLWDWLPPDPQPPVARNLNPPQSVPQNPPFVGGAQIPDGQLNTWIPPDQAPIVARNLVPPLTVSNPPFMGGASIPDGLLNWWSPPDPLPQLPAKYIPQPAATSYLAPNRLPVQWPVADWPFQVGARLTPPQSVPQNPPFTGAWQLPTSIQVAWLPALYEVALSIPAPPQPEPFVPFQVQLVAWPTPDPMFQVGARLTPPQSGPAPQNPPFRGTKVPTEVQVSWLPPDPRPITGPPLVQGAQAASPPPVRGARVPLEVQVAWIPPPPLPTLWPPFNGGLAPVSLVPVPLGGASVPDPVSVWWSIPAPPQPPTAPPLTPPSNPVPMPLGGASIPDPALVWWSIPAPPQPQVSPPFPLAPPAPQNPPFMGGASLPYPVTAWWNIPPPMYQVAVNLKPPIAGPPPVNPPFMGGAKVPLAVLVDWIPPPPQPPVAWTATQAFAPPPGVQLKTDPRFITLPQPRQQVTYPQPRMFVTVPQLQGTGMPRGNDFSLIDPSETATLTWDFAPWLAAGVTITSIVGTSCSLLTGTDAAPSSRLIGAPQIGASPTSKLASQGVLQQVQGMQNNATYILLCTVNTSDSQVLTLYAHQLCQGPT